MQDFQFLVTDDRYSVPSLRFVEAKDADAARAIAERLLLEHENYHVIDAWEGGAHAFTVGVAHRLRPRARWAPLGSGARQAAEGGDVARITKRRRAAERAR